MTRRLIEGKDYYNDEKGRMILTEEYLKGRGYCCECGCLHCPYGYNKKVDASVPSELQRDQIKGNSEDLTKGLPSDYEKYLEEADKEKD